MLVQAVSLRIYMFHAVFLGIVCRPAGTPLATVVQRHDVLYGIAPMAVQRRFKQAVADVLAVTTWPGFFACMHLPCPAPGDLAHKMDAARTVSAARGYHTPGMDFSKVQASGVSRILLKGESYSAAPDVNCVRMEELWHWRRGVQYMDASVLLVDRAGRMLDVVDYSRQLSNCGAIMHSGDVLDHHKHEGRHIIQVKLSKLPDRVSALYFVMTGFHVSLAEIVQVCVRPHTCGAAIHRPSPPHL
jgi:hypothetical protein